MSSFESAQSLRALSEQSAVCSFFSLVLFIPRCIVAVGRFLLRGCVFRPDDACQKRFSWFSDWIPKMRIVNPRDDLVDLLKNASYLVSTSVDTAKVGSDTLSKLSCLPPRASPWVPVA